MLEISIDITMNLNQMKQRPYDQNETEQKALERSMAYI